MASGRTSPLKGWSCERVQPVSRCTSPGSAAGRGLKACLRARPGRRPTGSSTGAVGLPNGTVNGPLGLEQGFTLERPPAYASGEALVLALQLSGAITAVPDSRGDGVSLHTPQGLALLRYRGLAAWDAEGRSLPAWWQIAGSEVRLRVDDATARYPLTIDPFFEDAKLAASDGAAGDFFGVSVAVSGNTVVVGAPGDDIGGNTNQGSAYVFVKPSGGWAGAVLETAKLIASDGGPADQFGIGENFGSSVGVSGDTVVVGAPFKDIGGHDKQGAVYVFVKPPGGWAGMLTENAQLTDSAGAAVSHFGSAVAINGDTVVVGTHIGGSDSGCHVISDDPVDVFVKPTGGWAGTVNQDVKLIASDGSAAEGFGTSVAVSGDTIVVGAPCTIPFMSSNRASAYVFVKPPAGWTGAVTEEARLFDSANSAFNDFGFSVAVSGDTVVVGEPGSCAWVFVKPAGGWAGALVENARLNCRGGVGVAVSGNRVAVRDAIDATSTFVKPAGGWAGVLSENALLTASEGAAGNDVALDSDTVVMGSPSDDFGANFNQGSAYVFELSNLPPPQCFGAHATIVGTNGRDRLNGTTGNDIIVGLGGNDIINGLGGKDLICGGEGRDKLNGGKGRDRLDGNGGRDICKGGSGRDTARRCERISQIP